MKYFSFRLSVKIAAFALLLPLLFGKKVPQITYAQDQYLVQAQEQDKAKVLLASATPVDPSVYSSAIPTSKPATVPKYAVNGDTGQLINKYASIYGADASIMAIIANCESGMRPEALSSSGIYGGMFQFNVSTWQSNRRALGVDSDPALRFNAEEAIKTAAFKMGRDGYSAWPVCSKKAFNLASI